MKLRSLIGWPGQPAREAAAPAVGREELDALESRLQENGRTQLEAAASQLRRDHEDLLKNQIRVQWRIIDEVRRQLPRPAELHCEICGFSGAISGFKQFDSHCIFGGGRLERHQCPNCDTIFGPAKMLDLSAPELSQEYEMHYRLYPEGDSTAAELRAFHALEPRREGVYLNYGAGAWSRSVQELRAQGWNVLAYEPHQAAARGEHLVSSEEHLLTMRFDGIFSNNVLEHFRHPAQALRMMQSLLNPSARMSHATPCFKYLYEYTRFHLFFFPGRSLQALAAAAGLQVDSFSADGDYMNAVLSPPGQRLGEEAP